MSHLARFAAVALALIFALPERDVVRAQDERKSRSPFEAVRWADSTPEVRVDGELYRLVAMDGSTAEEIVGFAQREFGDRWKKRFGEDLEEVLARMGRPVPESGVSALTLEPVGGGARVELPAVRWSAENRRAIHDAAERAEPVGKVDGEFEKLSPFAAVRWRGAAPEVGLVPGGEFYELRAIDGLAAAEIVEFCERRYRALSVKRFEEDLVEVLSRMGREPGRTVGLSLAPLGGGEPIEMPAVAMTRENRQAVWAAAKGRRGAVPNRPGDDDEFPKRAPFTAVRWVDGAPEVEVDREFRKLLAIDGVDTTEILGFCEKTYGAARARKRFSEDLVQVLTEMGREPGDEVTLRLARASGGGAPQEIRARMTEENRRSVLKANNAAASPPGGTAPRARREHAKTVPAEFRDLAKVVPAGDAARRLSAADAAADLDQLERHLEERYSYLALSGADHRAAIDAVRSGLADGISRDSFAIQVMKLLALLGDGHTRVDDAGFLPGGYLPFLLAFDGTGKLVAFEADRSRLVVEDHPYLASIDGVDAAKWLETAGLFVPRLSPVFHRQQSARFLREIQLLRRVRGLAEKATLDIVLASASGKTRKISMPVAARKPTYGEWPRTETRELKGGVGYLRIAEMADDPAFLASLAASMEAFRDTRGLVVDVRGNGGGSRAALLALAPYFMKEGAPPRIANVARYKLPPDEAPGRPDGYLEDRFLFPATASAWSGAERAAIEAFARGFRPEWSPPDSGFSDWHYLVLGGGRRDPKAFAFGKPVALLLDGDCFSATDVFLGALKGLPGVTLVGSPSGGGSGRSKGVVLEKSGLRLRVSTMASYRADGKLYDRNGVEPDVLVAPAPTDFVGKSDTVLDAALGKLGR